MMTAKVGREHNEGQGGEVQRQTTRCPIKPKQNHAPMFRNTQALRQPLWRGAFDAGAAPGLGSLLNNPFNMRIKQGAANEGLVHWGGHLYALSACGLPIELHKLSLDTLGPSSLGGAFSSAATAPLGGHYRLCSAPGVTGDAEARWVVMGAAQSGNGALVTWREIDQRGEQAAVVTHR